MADTKISALPAATLPLAGTEVLPIVQGGTTDKVSVADLTAGRAISATQLTLSTGNLIQGTAAKGVNFTANTPAAGMTSQLLNWYEEGTFAPTFNNTGGVTYGDQLGWFTRIGNTVHVTIYIRTTALITNANDVTIGGLPYGMSSSGGYYPVGSVFPERGFNSANATEGYQCIGIQGTSTIKIYGVKSGTGVNTTNITYNELQATDNRVRVNLTYRV